MTVIPPSLVLSISLKAVIYFKQDFMYRLVDGGAAVFFLLREVVCV